jgi:hypothetical protein
VAQELGLNGNNALPNVTPPQTPDGGPSTDFQYLEHAFEAAPPLTLSAWTVERIRAARDDHALGVFNVSALLADALMTDPRIFAGMFQRLGPLLGIPREVKGGERWNGKGVTEQARVEAEALFAPESGACPVGTMAAGFKARAMMGVCIMQIVWRPRPDGSRTDPEVRPWPMQLSFWNEYKKRYQLYTTEGTWTVEPNDGKWIVIELGPRGFLDGALRPLALLWADRSYAIRDRSNHSAAHGSLNLIGTLPKGVAPESPEGQKYKFAIMNLQRSRGGLVKGADSGLDALEAKTLAWQIFSQIVQSSNADIMLALNGINGETVYKPISQIDGVRYDLVRVELGAATTQYNQGLLRPWALYNFGDEGVVPKLGWLVPDPREQERIDALGRQHAAFTSAINGYRAAGTVVDQPFVERLAQQFGVEEPKLAPTPPPAPAASPAKPAAAATSSAADDAQVEAGADQTA